MKTAKVEYNSILIRCPECNENIENPAEGSLQFDLNDHIPETLQCQNCGKHSKLPKKIKGRS